MRRTGSCAWHPTQRTARGTAVDVWQSSHVAVRWIPNETGKRRSCPCGATWSGLAAALNDAGSVAGAQAMDRWHWLQSRENGAVVAFPT